MKRQSSAAVEPVIEHLKSDHRMDRSFLIGEHGDATNAVLAAVGDNFARRIAWLRAIFCVIGWQPDWQGSTRHLLSAAA